MIGRPSGGWAAPAPRVLAALGLTTLAAILFSDLLTGSRVLYERDLHQILWGQITSFRAAVEQGFWPLWDSWRGFGEPLLANPSAEALYPWTWLGLVLPPPDWYDVFAISHVVLAGLGMLCLGRVLGVSVPAALVMAAVWMASGPLLSLVNLWHHLAGAAWMPWVCASVEALCRAPSRRRIVATSAAGALQGLAGSADMCLLTAIACAALSARHLLPPAAPARGAARAASALAVAAVLATGLVAPVWLPALELVRASDRAALPPALRSYWSVHPLSLLQVVTPVLPHRLPLSPEDRNLLYEGVEPFLGSLYLGALAVPLVAAAFVGPRRRAAFVLGGLALLCALFALGRFGVLHDLVLAALPPLRTFRFPAKAMVLVAFCWAVLAGFGIDTALRARSEDGPRRERWLVPGTAALMLAYVAIALIVGWLAPGPLHALALLPEFAEKVVHPLARTALLCGASVVAAVLGGRGRTRSAGAVAALGGLAVLDLAAAHRGLNATAPRALFTSPPPVVQALRSDGANRVFVFDYAMRILGKAYQRAEPEIPRPGQVPELALSLRSALARQAFLSPPAATRWGLRGSFEQDWLGLKPRPARSLTLVLRAVEETPDFIRLLRIGGVTHVVSLHDTALGELVPVADFMDPLAGSIHVFRVPDPLPRAYAASSFRTADGLDALKLLVDPAFDPRREVVVPSSLPPRLSLPPLAEPAAPAGSVRIARETSDRVQIEADLPAEGCVVLLVAYDPGWTAQVDGKPRPVLRANAGFLAARAEGGHHVVEFAYRPDGLQEGGTAAVVAVLALIGLAWPRRGGRPSAAGPEPATS